jgi:hypothetical protein
MSKSFKFTADAKTAYLLHQRTLQENRCISNLVRCAMQKYLALDPPTEPMIGVESIEFAEGEAKATAVYLSHKISAAGTRLANERRRSKSFVVRELLRRALNDELLVPSSGTAPSSDDVTTDAA